MTNAFLILTNAFLILIFVVFFRGKKSFIFFNFSLILFFFFQKIIGCDFETVESFCYIKLHLKREIFLLGFRNNFFFYTYYFFNLCSRNIINRILHWDNARVPYVIFMFCSTRYIKSVNYESLNFLFKVNRDLEERKNYELSNQLTTDLF